MTWNYRIIEDKRGDLALHEAYYDNATDHCPSITVNPISFTADAEEGKAGIVDSLRWALRDAEKLPVLKLAQLERQWAKKRKH